MMSNAHRLILGGACLLAGRSTAFHMPVANSLSRNVHKSLINININSVQGNSRPTLRRKVHSSSMQAESMQETIEVRLADSLSPVHMEVINESHMHSGPAKESHFKVWVEVLPL